MRTPARQRIIFVSFLFILLLLKCMVSCTPTQAVQVDIVAYLVDKIDTADDGKIWVRCVPFSPRYRGYPLVIVTNSGHGYKNGMYLTYALKR
jgi:hypothetical protein